MSIHHPVTPKPFITGRLASGIEIKATSVFMKATYADVLEGPANDRMNALNLASLPSVYEKFWTTEPVPAHVVPSEVERFELFTTDDFISLTI